MASSDAKPGEETTELLQERPQNTENKESPEPKTQGAILLQSILRLSAPHNDIVLNRSDSVYKMLVRILTVLTTACTRSQWTKYLQCHSMSQAQEFLTYYWNRPLYLRKLSGSSSWTSSVTIIPW